MGLGLEIIENSFLERFCNDFWGWAWKYLKIAPWKHSGVQNRHFYSCTRGVFAIGFRKNYDFAIDILTIFENVSSDVLFHEDSVIFSFDHPSIAKWQLFSRSKDFLASPEIRESPGIARNR